MADVKTVSPQSIIGQLGANLIERIVLRMGYVWRQLLVFDVGIDGDIEVCDPSTGEATNAIIRVQAKATSRAFQSETDESLEYTCEQRDLDYWLRGNAPVILIVCRPDTDEAYWVSIRDYFKDTAALKSRKVRFVKARNRFDENCAPALAQLSLSRDSGIYFSPLAKREKLYTNLLRVTSYANDIFIAATDFRERSDVWEHLKSYGKNIGPEWIITNKQIMSFHNLREYPFNTICDPGTCESFDASEWAEAEDDMQREFVQLLNLSLKERCHLLGLRFFHEGKRRFFYFPASATSRARKGYQSMRRQSSRDIFKRYTKKGDPTQQSYCRHMAFNGLFQRLDGDWYLEITPTYHFTCDGRNEDRFHEERLKGIKRLDRNPAVLGQLLLWADTLKQPIQSLFAQEYPFLSFDNLVTFELDAGIPDDVWYNSEEGIEALTLGADENLPTLLNL